MQFENIRLPLAQIGAARLAWSQVEVVGGASDAGRPLVQDVGVEDVPTNPRHVGLLGAAAVVPGADGCANSVEKSRLRCAAQPASRAASPMTPPSPEAGYEMERVVGAVTVPIRLESPSALGPNIAERAERRKAHTGCCAVARG